MKNEPAVLCHEYALIGILNEIPVPLLAVPQRLLAADNFLSLLSDQRA